MGSKIALVVTKWVNLGPGLTPDDILWRAHVHDYRVLDNDSECIPEHLYTHPRVCFERAASQPFKDLGSHNLAILKEREYLTSSSFRRSPWTNNMWFMSLRTEEHSEVVGMSKRRNPLRSLRDWAVLSGKNRDRLWRAVESVSLFMDEYEGKKGSGSPFKYDASVDLIATATLQRIPGTL
ncbi:hypothetical protein N7493_001510 [Penicillium malachiteum]|uniref:Uncharacterized protein n=1 Tax=Penicillium malachiteum TaxID=1324776 RepID=A0AAD6HUB0_9EURO|nr:hypothetical protein N7493_001510 [Penicillium malachiteum]